MNIAPEAIAFERGIQPVLDIPLPGHESELAELRPDPRLATRIEELARKSNEGELSPDEHAEYQGYVQANKFVAILSRQARRALNSRVNGNE